MTKSNREKNQEHDLKELMKVRPKQPDYDFKSLEEVIKQWVKANEQT